MSYDANQKNIIKLALRDILDSPGFVNSSQLSSFLSFIVSKTLDNKTNEIKGYTIGVDALGRPDNFDPQVDPSVRVMAGRLRQSLENYKRDTGGFTKDKTTVDIELVKGSYVPKFTFTKAEDMEAPAQSDKLATLLETDIDIGLDKVKTTKSPPSDGNKSKNLMLISACVFSLFALGFAGYHYYTEHYHIEPTVLPQKQVIAIEDATLPSLSLFINAEQEALPNWVKAEQLHSNAVIAFSRFNEYRVFSYNGKDDLVFLDQITSDYYLSVFFSKVPNSNSLVAYSTLTRPPDSEVVWSDKVFFEPHAGQEALKNLQKISTMTSEIMSPYGIIHGDITSNKNPPPRLDCIRAIYSYFAKEDLQAYSNGLDCARRATSRKQASSSMYSMLTFLYVEAYRKQIIEVSDTPLKDAAIYAKKAITLDPKNARAFQALFAVEKTRGNVEEAVNTAKKAIELNPYDRDIIGDYAAYLVSINEQEKAKPILEQAIELTPVLPAWLAFFKYLHADATGDFKTADNLAAKFNAEDSPLIAAAIILSAARQNDTKRAHNAANILNISEPGFAANPKATLLRRGFDEAFADEIASRLKAGGLNKQVTKK